MKQPVEDKRTKVVKTLINKMFEIAKHDIKYEDIIDREDDWYTYWTMTEKENAEWREWGTKYIKKELKHLTESQCKTEMEMIDLNYGLKINNQIDY